MTLYSKWFDNHNAYETYKNGQDYILPNVSICFNDLDVHYDPYKDPRFIATFNITDISSPSIIAGKKPWVSTPWFTDVEIDGEIISNEDIIMDNAYIRYQFNNTGKHTVKFSFDNQEMTTIDSFTFYSTPTDNISEMESLIIPFGITSINGIDNFHNLTSVTIPNSVTTLSGFNNCTGLTSVTIPNSVTTLSGFNNCTGLTSVTIPNSVTTLSTNSFSYCTGLTSVTIPNSVTTLGDYAFSNCTGLTSVTISNSVTTISDYAFSNCTGLTSVTIPNSVTTISTNSFSYCTGLTSVTIPNSVTTLGGFSDCTGLTSITIPNSVTSISGFSGCTGLTSITIPDSVTSISGSAFYGCTGLTSVTCLPITPPTHTGSPILFDTNDCPIYVPAESVNTYKTTNGWDIYPSRIQAIP